MMIVVVVGSWRDLGRYADVTVVGGQTFLDTFVCQANNNGTGYFFFEYFDETWKDAEFGGVEGHWGLFYSKYVRFSLSMNATSNRFFQPDAQGHHHPDLLVNAFTTPPPSPSTPSRSCPTRPPSRSRTTCSRSYRCFVNIGITMIKVLVYGFRWQYAELSRCHSTPILRTLLRIPLFLCQPTRKVWWDFLHLHTRCKL